ncbi:MAG TPA: hypothetical protein VGF55_18605 [Gemmataceae bacterium]|jgi:hypothetical protein
MRLHPVWGLILFFLAALATTSLARGAELAGGTPKGYELRTVEGFTVYVNRKVLQQPVDRWGRQPLTVLEQELHDLHRILVPKMLRILQDVPIWAEWDLTHKLIPNAIAVYYGGTAEGLLKLSGDPRKVNCVEILSMKRLGEVRHPGRSPEQIIILREMAHVVHHRLLGWDNPELKATFQQALDRDLYDEVNDRSGRRTTSSARTNVAQYFAEVSCAYLDSCNYFPFNRAQLRGYDPTGYAFLERVWTHPEQVTAIAKKPTPEPAKGAKGAATGKPAPGKPAAGKAPAAPRLDAFAERSAQLRLDKLLIQMREGDPQKARPGLEDLIRLYPGTTAAGDAEKLLKVLN